MQRLLIFLLFCGVLFNSARGANHLWSSPRGGPGGQASCPWQPPPRTKDADAGPNKVEIRQWHYRSKASSRYKMGQAVWASPALAVINKRPMVFIGGYDQRMHALDLLTKEPRWIFASNGAISSPPAVGAVEGRAVVFWGSGDGHLYAFFAEGDGRGEGRPLWKRQLINISSTMDEVKMSGVLLHSGRLYICSFSHDKPLSRSLQKGQLHCLDMKSGRSLWSIELSNGPLGHPIGRIIDQRLHIFVCARKGLLQALDASGPTPTRLWTYQMPHEVMGSPAIEETGKDPLLFLGSKFGNIHAIKARTGTVAWKKMAGNWIDNSACLGMINGRRHVFVGSHDYNVYAFESASGKLRWKKHLGGEIYSAPAFFRTGKSMDATGKQSPFLAVASLDNHLYILEAETGQVATSYYTGTPIWDKVAKGQTLWGSPAVLEAGDQTAIIHGSFNNFVYVYPFTGKCELRTKAQSPSTLGWGLLITLLLFCGIVLPIVLKLPVRKNR